MGFKSAILLGTQLLLHLLGLLWPFGRERGAKRFLENYRADHIRPVTTHERELVPLWQRCTNCGLCEAVCPLDTVPGDALGLSFTRLAIAGWRDLSAHRLIQASAKAMEACQPCGDCESACPEEIPLRELARLVANPAA